MAVTVQWFAQGLQHYLDGDIDYIADPINVALLNNTYTPDFDADEFWKGGSGIGDSSQEASGSGYTADGDALTTKALATTASGALSAWQASQAYNLGDIVRAVSDDGFAKICVVAGTSSGSEPTWVTTAFRETADNTVVWGNLGPAVIGLDFDNPSWDPSTVTARYAALFRDGSTPGTDDFVFGLIDFGQDESSSNGPFDIIIPSTTPVGALFLGSGAAI